MWTVRLLFLVSISLSVKAICLGSTFTILSEYITINLFSFYWKWIKNDIFIINNHIEMSEIFCRYWRQKKSCLMILKTKKYQVRTLSGHEWPYLFLLPGTLLIQFSQASLCLIKLGLINLIKCTDRVCASVITAITLTKDLKQKSCKLDLTRVHNYYYIERFNKPI